MRFSLPTFAAMGSRRLAAISLLALSTSGCALFTKADLVTIRYYSPERPAAHTTSGDSASKGAPLRLGRISSGTNLRERIAHRDTSFEVGYYEDNRWIERPEVFVRRKLSQTLFEEHGFQRVLTGFAPTLEAEVVSFEERKEESGRTARIELKVVLSDETSVLFEDTIVTEKKVASKEKMEDFVAGMSDALDAMSETVTTRVEAALRARAAAVPTSPTPAVAAPTK